MSAVRTLAKRTNDPAMPAIRAETISPSDGNDLEAVTRGIYVGQAGNIRVVTAGGDTTTFVNVPAGSILPLAVARVLLTGTTATDLVALW